MKSAWRILKETFTEFSQDRVLRLSAATAYYAVFSIAPLLVLIVGVAGLVFGQEEVRAQVTNQLKSMVGGQSAKMVESMMSAQEKGGSLLATIIGAVGLVLGASGVFGQLQDSLNTIWGVVTRPGQGIGGLIRARFFSMAMVLGVGFLLLVSLALSAAVNAFAEYLGSALSIPPWVAPVFQFAMSFVVVTVLFASIFKVLPDATVGWRDVWIGAIGTAFLFTLGKFLLGLYLGRQATASPYGAGSAFIMVLLYIYYSSIILYLGAEFTQVYARRNGGEIQPGKYAVRLTDEEYAKQGMPRQGYVEDLARRQQQASEKVPKHEG
jgi:membrane protein